MLMLPPLQAVLPFWIFHHPFLPWAQAVGTHFMTFWGRKQPNNVDSSKQPLSNINSGPFVGGGIAINNRAATTKCKTLGGFHSPTQIKTNGKLLLLLFRYCQLEVCGKAIQHQCRIQSTVLFRPNTIKSYLWPTIMQVFVNATINTFTSNSNSNVDLRPPRKWTMLHYSRQHRCRRLPSRQCTKM